MWCFKVVKYSSIEDVDGLNVPFNILHKNNGFSKLIKRVICYKLRVLNQCL